MGLSNYDEGSRKGMVQQVNAKLHKYLQGIERIVWLALYRGAQA